MIMADLENLKDSQGVQTNPESLTDEQAKAIVFSPELEERNEYFMNIIDEDDIDIYKMEEFMTKNDISISSLENILINDYWFTKEEVEEAWKFLDEVKHNPNALENDSENTDMLPVLPIIWAIIKGLSCIGAGVWIWYFIRGRKDHIEENIYITEWKRDAPKEVFKVITAEQKFTDVEWHAKISSDASFLKWLITIENFQKKEVSLLLDGKVSASFDSDNFMENASVIMTSDGEWHLKIVANIPRPHLIISDVYVHDVKSEDNVWNRLFRNKELDKAHEDAYNVAINSIIQNKETSNEFYEFARKSYESKIGDLYKLACKMWNLECKSVDVEVNYTTDIWIITYKEKK